MGELRILYQNKWYAYLINTEVKDFVMDQAIEYILKHYPKDAIVEWKDNPYISPFTTTSELMQTKNESS